MDKAFAERYKQYQFLLNRPYGYSDLLDEEEIDELLQDDFRFLPQEKRDHYIEQRGSYTENEKLRLVFPEFTDDDCEAFFQEEKEYQQNMRRKSNDDLVPGVFTYYRLAAETEDNLFTWLFHARPSLAQIEAQMIGLKWEERKMILVFRLRLQGISTRNSVDDLFQKIFQEKAKNGVFCIPLAVFLKKGEQGFTPCNDYYEAKYGTSYVEYQKVFDHPSQFGFW